MFNSKLNEQVNKELIEKERFTLYMNEMLRHYIGSILAGLPLFYFIFQSQASVNAMNIWFSLDAILMLVVLFTYYGFYQHNDIFHSSTWNKISNIPVIVFSLHMAAAPWLFLPIQADIYLYTMFIMLISLSGTVTHVLAYYFEKLVIFSALPLFSLAIKFYMMESENSLEVYTAFTLVWVALIVYAYRVNKSLIRSITLKFEHLQARANAERINAEKSQFIAAASHDIRQPLQAVNLLVDTLRSRNTNPKDEVLLERLENSVESMSELLNSMLDVSKLDAQVIVPQPQHCCLTTLLEKLKGEFEPLARTKGVKLIIEAEDNIVLADVILLKQVISNLLSNAIRYTQFGEITLSVKNDSGKINISVKDTGVGIAVADQEAIFLEFFQLDNPERDQNKGLGLGLSIVKRLCLLQNWPLSLDSELGIGSCFSFTIPQGDHQLIQVVDRPYTNNNLTAVDVIVIDDHEGIRFSLSRMLDDWGCNVRSFESASDACEAIKQRPSWQPNLVISDYRLRNNLNGIAAIDSVRAALNTPIEAILISGDTSPEIITKIEKSGLILLNKPIKPAKLRVIISRKMKATLDENIEMLM